ncbi:MULTISPECIES: hypothetical protein [unclassified Streptomyces]|uniref:hypothetical protein n=1 Tax=unclassified Streptomyces TaxID=2593676 RepID=UPI0033F66AA1
MEKDLRTFIQTYLDEEQGYDTSGYLRPTLMAFAESYVQSVRSGLAEILRDRTLTVGDYERLTNIEFPDVDSLYEYLEQLSAYLFEDGPNQPLPPE